MVEKAWVKTIVEEVLKNSKTTKSVAKVKFINNEYRMGINKYFHSIRILDFANQIIEKGKIEDYSSMNWLWDELKNSFFTWDEIEDKYNELYLTKRDRLSKSLTYID